MPRFLLIMILLVFVSCGQNQSSDKSESTNAVVKTVDPNEIGEQKMHPDYPHIPLADLGITVVSEDGWDEKTLEFHLGYCEQMMGKLGDKYHTNVFCDCFVKKIQYYYEPIFFKEAYTDQKRWNQECLKAATKEE